MYLFYPIRRVSLVNGWSRVLETQFSYEASSASAPTAPYSITSVDLFDGRYLILYE